MPEPSSDFAAAIAKQVAEFAANCNREVEESLRRSQEMSNHYLQHGLTPMPMPSGDDLLLAQFLANPVNREKVLALAKQPAPG